MKIKLAILAVGLLVGALMGWFASSRTEHLNHDAKSTHPNPESWLFPREFTLADIYSQPPALEILRNPDRTTLHKFGKRDLTVGGFAFDATSRTPDADDAKALLVCLRSPNAYTPVSACAFEPGVLVRLEKSGHRLDVLICFTCTDLAWMLDGEAPAGGAAVGISDIGIASLKALFHRVWPEEPFFLSNP